MSKNNSSGTPNIFGRVQIAYLVIESLKLDDWRRFLKQGIGMHLESESDESLAFRMDAHARRLMVQKGNAEDVVAIGLQLRDDETMDIVLHRLSSRNIAVEHISGEQAKQRGANSIVRIRGPKSITLDIFVDATTIGAPLNMLASGFTTGDSGMGHVAITSRLPEKMQRFWQEIFDARVSDHVSQALGGVMLDVTFLRLNERHHSVAIAATRGLRLDPIRTRVQHFNIVANHLEDVSGAFERLRDLGYEMAHEIGQHPNDKEVSFYAICPSGFEVELGWNPLRVDESTWIEAKYNAISTWGHKPENPSALNALLVNLGNAGRGLRAAFKSEYSPL